jgi:Subtilase family
VKAGTSIAALAAAVLAAPAPASAAELKHAPPALAVSLPGDAVAASLNADPRTWIVGTRAGGGALARAHGARRIAGRAWLAPRGRTRALAAALRERGLLEYAEPNRLSRRAQAPLLDPLSAFAPWRDFVVGDQVPPPVTRKSPLIGVVDTQIDLSHPEIAGSNITSTAANTPVDLHGTATTTVAAAPKNDVGILGLWPGARALNVTLPTGKAISCSDSARGIARATAEGAAVINMSYGAISRCIAEEQQIMRAVKAGAIPVAAAGNEFEKGNPLEFPASLPHVITVGAVGPDDRPTTFSNESGAVDLSAYGSEIIAGVPARFDSLDGAVDGFAVVAGTSFAAPMVSAAVAWVRAARPELTPFQAAQVVRLGARDVGARGYESATGFGVLHMPGALSRRAPADDPREPNDDTRYVDGRAFGNAARPLYTGRAASIAATADYAEDPVDVYRVKIPSGRRVRLSLRPSVGDPDLYVFGRRARSVRTSRPLRTSIRRGRAIERASVRNRGRRTRTIHVAVGFDADKKLELFNTSYVLRVR